MRTPTGQSIPNIESATSDYPYGRAKNESTPGALDGTPTVEEVNGIGDILQAMIQLLVNAGLTPDENPENASSSQINDALDTLYGNSAQPVAVLMAVYDSGSTNMVTRTTLGNGLAHSWTKGSFVSATNSCPFNLNITDAGDYIVNIAAAKDTLLSAGSSKYLNRAYHAEHDLVSTPGYFDNNVMGNINVTAGNPDAASSVSEATLLTDVAIVITVYKA